MTRPGNIRRGVLEVFVANSTLLQELAFQKTQLLERLRQAAARRIDPRFAIPRRTDRMSDRGRIAASRLVELERCPWLARHSERTISNQRQQPIESDKDLPNMTDHPTAGDKPTDKPADKATDQPATNGRRYSRLRRLPPPHDAVKSADQNPDMPITAPNMPANTASIR